MTSTTNTSFNIGVKAPRKQHANRASHWPRWILTGLSNFVFSTGTGSFGVGNLVSRGPAPGRMRLANTSNSITAANLVVGDSNQSGGNNGGAGSTLFLGAGSNVLNVNTINVGFTKSTGSIQFQSGSGSVTIGGEAGGAATTNIVVGRGSSATDTGTTRTFLLAGHTANIQAGTVQIGVLAGATGGTTTGQMTFDTGTFNVSSLQLAVSSSGSAPNGRQRHLLHHVDAALRRTPRRPVSSMSPPSSSSPIAPTPPAETLPAHSLSTAARLTRPSTLLDPSTQGTAAIPRWNLSRRHAHDMERATPLALACFTDHQCSIPRRVGRRRRFQTLRRRRRQRKRWFDHEMTAGIALVLAGSNTYTGGT